MQQYIIVMLMLCCFYWEDWRGLIWQHEWRSWETMDSLKVVSDKTLWAESTMTVWGGVEGGMNTVCASSPLPPSFFHSSVVSMLSRACKVALYMLLYILDLLMLCTYWLTFVPWYACSCFCTVRFPFVLCAHGVLCIWISMGTACTKQHNSMPAGSVGDVCMSFCPLESYERDWTRAECGSSGVLFMASLLPICDIRSRAQGNCQGKEGSVTGSVSLCMCIYVYVWVEREGGKKDNEGKTVGGTGDGTEESKG